MDYAHKLMFLNLLNSINLKTFFLRYRHTALIVEQFDVNAAYEFLLRSTHQQTQQT